MPHPFEFVETFPHGSKPPKSPGLPPSGPNPDGGNKPRDREHRRHPAKIGRPTTAERELAVQTTLARMDQDPPEKIARLVSRDTATIKALIKSARQDLQSRAGDYVAAHWNATKVAADLGDAKPAQWALERISEGEQRVVEKEKAGSTSPNITIGIKLGGIPQPQAAIDVTPIIIEELAESASVPDEFAENDTP